jgi:thioredoxin-related protein
MKDIVFKNKKIVQYINKHFIVLSFDIQKDKLPRGYEYDGIPTFFFINQNRKLIGKIIGGDKANRFLKKLKEIK